LPDWLFVSVTIFSELVAPTGTFPKFTDAGDTEVCAMPAPVRGNKAGLFEAFVTTLSDSAGTAPTAVGVSVSEITQVEPAATELPQVVEDKAYSAGGVIEVIPSADVCQL
jgi:hypothetical protein